MERNFVRRLLVLLALFSFAACETNAPTPAAATWSKEWQPGGMAAAANPYAVQAAVEILEAGGHAVDAAIAAHAVLGLVEPQSSGLGGGAIMLVYERDDHKLVVYDGRETAPRGATKDLFLDNGERIGFREAWQSGLSVGVPGVTALYADSHRAHGMLDMQTVLAPAIRFANEGFVVSPRMAGFLVRLRDATLLDDNPATSAYFYPDGEPLQAGDLRPNPEYAETLRSFATRGTRAFYTGEVAAKIVSAVQAEPRPGTLSLDDLVDYEVIEREALCADVADNRICSVPPPFSGVAQLMILALYDSLIAEQDATDEAVRLSAFVDAQRLSYADRDHYIADPDFVAVPTRDLIDPRYLSTRATQRFAPNDTPTPGDPGAVLRGEPMLAMWGSDPTDSAPGTSHLSIVDINGNAVSMSASVNAPFGSSRWAAGFVLNNELTDFARQPMVDGQLVANAAGPRKRPRSSMSPVMVFDATGNLELMTGSAGGNSIIAYIAKTVIGTLRWEMDIQAAVDMPNIVARGERVRVETVGDGDRFAVLLKQMGYDVQEREGENSGLHAIVVSRGRLKGGADPRREGQAIAVARPEEPLLRPEKRDAVPMSGSNRVSPELRWTCKLC